MTASEGVIFVLFVVGLGLPIGAFVLVALRAIVAQLRARGAYVRLNDGPDRD